jgi:hypothetical protein
MGLFLHHHAMLTPIRVLRLRLRLLHLLRCVDVSVLTRPATATRATRAYENQHEGDEGWIVWWTGGRVDGRKGRYERWSDGLVVQPYTLHCMRLWDLVHARPLYTVHTVCRVAGTFSLFEGAQRARERLDRGSDGRTSACHCIAGQRGACQSSARRAPLRTHAPQTQQRGKARSRFPPTI